MNLSQTTQEVLLKIEMAEKEGRFNDHIDDVVNTKYIPVDEEFTYEKKWFQKIGYTLLKKGIVSPYAFIANHLWLKTKVVGRSNLNGISTGAILTSNHVNKLDSLAIGYAIKKKRIHYTVAEFNNMDCNLGRCMRAYGIMPIPSKRSMLPRFEQQLQKYLNRGDWINFFPECSEWWCYEKPRPYQIGAFHYAAKYQVPIVPLFITFHKTKKYLPEGIEQRQFIVHILKPIYPNLSLPLKERKNDLKRRNETMIWDCYHRFYLSSTK